MGEVGQVTADPTDGEAARQALMLLVRDERFSGPIEAMLKGPAPERMAFGPVGLTLLSAGILLALQTHFKFERDKDGRWSVKIEKKATSSALLAPLVKKLMSIAKLS